MQAPLSAAILFALSAIAGPDHRPPLPQGGKAAPVAQTIEGCDVAPLGGATVATLNNTPLVTVYANGFPLVLVLDTGAQRTVVTPAAAGRIGGKAPRIEFERGLKGIAGALPTREIELQSYRIGDVAIPWRRVTVASITTAAVFPTSLDGVLGTDSLSSFDIDLDLPRHRITLYEPGKCGKSGPNWPGQHARIDAGRSPGDHLFFPVLLDNRRITAMIDTGAQRTTLSTTVALALGVTEAALARDRAIKTRGAANEELHSRLHQFARLEIAPLVIRNPEIVVTDLRLRDADIVLGMDLLGTRRLWLSYKSFRILLSDR